MADIEYVSPGQPVRASTINGIIDGLGGPMQPCSESFLTYQRTGAGSIYMTHSEVMGCPSYVAPQFLDVAWGPSLSGEQELVLNLGRDKETALKLLPGNPTKVFFGDYSGGDRSAGSLVELQTSAFAPNGEGRYFDGWVQTGIYGLERSGEGDAVLDGCLYMYQMEGDDGCAVVFTNAAEEDTFKDDLKGQSGWKSVENKGKTPIATQTPASLQTEGGNPCGGSLIRIHNAVPETEADNYLFRLRCLTETKEEGEGESKKTLKRAVMQWWDNSTPTHGGVQWNTYGFTGPTSQDSRWQELTATDWASEIPEFEVKAWLKVNAAGAYPARSTEDYLQTCEWAVVTEKKDDEECWIGGLEGGKGLGSRWVRAYYPIGRFWNSGYGDGVRVEQCMLGSLNVLDMSFGCDGNGGGGSTGDDSHRFTADSLLSSAECSSISRDSYRYTYMEKTSTGEYVEKEATGYYFSLYNFKHAEGENVEINLCPSGDYRLPDRYKLLVRDNHEDLSKAGTTPELRYATLSTYVPAMTADSEVDGSDSYSVQISGKDHGFGVTQLYNFATDTSDGEIKFDKATDSLPDGTEVMTRVKEGDAYYLRYQTLKVEDLSGSTDNANAIADLSASVKCDTEVVEQSKTKSIEKGKYKATVYHEDVSGNVTPEEIEATYFRLFRFDDLSDPLVKKDVNEGKYDVLVRDRTASEAAALGYMSLSSFVTLSADSAVEDTTKKSVQFDEDKVVTLYNFDSAASDKIEIDKDNPSTKDGTSILIRKSEGGVNTLSYASLSMAFPETTLTGDSQSPSYGSKSVKVDEGVVTLHNFRGHGSDATFSIKDEEGSKTLPDGVNLLYREGSDLKYGGLSVTFPSPTDDSQYSKLSGMWIADSDEYDYVPWESNFCSIERWGGYRDPKTFVFGLFGFQNLDDRRTKEELEGKEVDVLIRRHDTHDLQYLNLSSLSGADVKCDSESLLDEKYASKRASLEKASDGLYQLYGFDNWGSTSTITVSGGEIVDKDKWQIVARHQDSDTTNLVYTDLKVVLHGGDGQSVEETEEKDKFRLKDWVSHSTVALTSVNGSDYEMLVKDCNSGNLGYATLSISGGGGDVYVDSEKSSTSFSLEKSSTSDGASYVKIRGFDTDGNVSSSALTAYQDDYDVLLRHTNGGAKEVKYAALKDVMQEVQGAETVNYSWMWKKDEDGNWMAPGTFTMGGVFLYGTTATSYSGTVPAGSGFLCINIQYGSPGTSTGPGSPKSVSFEWTTYLTNLFSLEGCRVPLWYHDGTKPTMDYRAGVFTVPVYS